MNPWDRLCAGIAVRRRFAVAICAAITVASLRWAPSMAINADPAELFPRSNREVAFWLDLSKRFGVLSSLLVGLEEPEAPLTIEGLTHLAQVTRELERLKAEGVLGVRSLTNVASLAEGADGALQNTLLVNALPMDETSRIAMANRIGADTQVSGALVSRDQFGYLILVTPDPRFSVEAVAGRIRTVVEASKGPLRTHYFGGAFFAQDVSIAVEEALSHRGLVALVLALLVGILAWGVRRPGVILLVLGSAAVSLVWSIGLARLFQFSITPAFLSGLLPAAVLSIGAFARSLDVSRAAPDIESSPFPSTVADALVCIGLGAAILGRAAASHLGAFGNALALGAVSSTLVGVLFFVPGASFLSPIERGGVSRARAGGILRFVLLAIVLAAAAGAALTRAVVTPQGLFGDNGPVGRALVFFDRRFGGADVVQVSFRGDLRNPSVAARLMRLTDLLEGAPKFGDVRSVTQVLGFLNRTFAGVWRIPSDAEALGALWILLEGNGDVRALVSDRRDEAMLGLRIPSLGVDPLAVRQVVEKAAADSIQVDAAATKRRILAVGQAFRIHFDLSQLDEVLAEARRGVLPAETASLNEQVGSRLRQWLRSDDSPYSPTDEEWSRLSVAVASPELQRPASVLRVAESLEGLRDPAMARKLTDSILTRERDLRINEIAARLARRLQKSPLPPALDSRLQGAIVDFVDPPSGSGESATVVVSGLPLVARAAGRALVTELARALAALISIASLGLLVLRRSIASALLVGGQALVATALGAALFATIGFEIDAVSSALFLVPIAVTFLVAAPVQEAESKFVAPFLQVLVIAGLGLGFVPALPIQRMGAALAAGLVGTFVASRVFRRPA